jgi:hypothetical protein
MEAFCVIFALAFVFNLIKKLFVSDDASTQQQQAAANGQNAAYEIIGGGLGRVAVIGLYAAGSDGEMGQAERQTVTKWLNGKIEDIKEEHQARIRQEANKVFNPIASSVSELEMTRAASGIPAELGSMRQDAMQLAFKVVADDGILAPGEYKALQTIQKALDITDARFRDLYDIHLSNLKRHGTTGTAAQIDELGIIPSWSKDQKLAHLTKEFSKYNHRMQSAKEQSQRDYCKRMLDLITRAREQLMGTAKPVNHDEVLLGIESSLCKADKSLLLEKEEERWLSRQQITQKPAAIQTCRDALDAIKRLRLLYAASN